MAAGERVAALEGRCRLVVTGPDGGSWVFSCRHPVEVIADGEVSQVDCTVTVSGDDLVAWARGGLNPQVAFVTGRIKVRGDGCLALRLAEFLG
jgi:predicted lipid carrier protein YhbT